MKKLKIVFWVIVGFLLVLVVLGEGEKDTAVSATSPTHTNYLPTIQNQAGSRSFLMGMNPLNYDVKSDTLAEGYDFVDDHTDLILHHLDWGIPWPEAYAKTAYHPHVEADLDYRVGQRRAGQKVYLALAPQASDRTALADYWAEDGYLERPAAWQNVYFDDPKVIEAYLNYARDLIDRFEPDYFNYAIEATDNFKQNDPQFDQFLVFAEQVHTTLKAEYPNLPIFASLSTFVFENGELVDRTAVAKQILPYSDLVAISTYPFYITYPGNPDQADPAKLPEDWLSRWVALVPNKPFAIAETSFPAEDVKIGSGVIDIEATAAWQADYVNWMLDELNQLDAEFVAWFVPRDYDNAWAVWGSEAEPFAIFWKDTGLLDGDGGKRPSLQVWDSWLDYPHR